MDIEEQNQRIKEFLERTLARNATNIMIICENIYIPEDATISAETFKNKEIKYSSFIKTSDSSILIEGDFVVIHT